MSKIVDLDSYRKSSELSEKESTTRFYLLLENLKLLRKYQRCCICKWEEEDINLCLMTSYNEGGDYDIDNVVPLCPNHCITFNKLKLKQKDYEPIQEFLWTICSTVKPWEL